MTDRKKGAFPYPGNTNRMKILLVRPPRFLRPLLRKICGVKKEK